MSTGTDNARSLPTSPKGSPIQHVGIFANPIAGRGRARRIAQLLVRRFESNQIRATAFFDPPPKIMADQLRELDGAVIIGGDGTLRAVASRFYAELAAIPPLLAVPMGTANLLNRHLRGDWSSGPIVPRVVDSIKRRQIQAIDVAQANGQLFLLMAGIGMDAWIIHELDRIRTGPINYLSYLLPAAMALKDYQYTPLSIELDGKEIFAAKPAMVFIGNVREYGTGFPLLPNAVSDDGLLDVCAVPVRSRNHAVQQFLRAAAGQLLEAEGVVYARGKEIIVESPQPVPMQIDGDPAGYTPARIGLLPIKAPFIVPI